MKEISKSDFFILLSALKTKRIENSKGWKIWELSYDVRILAESLIMKYGIDKILKDGEKFLVAKEDDSLFICHEIN